MTEDAMYNGHLYPKGAVIFMNTCEFFLSMNELRGVLLPLYS